MPLKDMKKNNRVKKFKLFDNEFKLLDLIILIVITSIYFVLYCLGLYELSLISVVLMLVPILLLYGLLTSV